MTRHSSVLTVNRIDTLMDGDVTGFNTVQLVDFVLPLSRLMFTFGLRIRIAHVRTESGQHEGDQTGFYWSPVDCGFSGRPGFDVAISPLQGPAGRSVVCEFAPADSHSS